MRTFTIKKKRFLEWYFEDGQDSEIASLKEELAEKVIQQLEQGKLATISTGDIFDDCNTSAIKICYLEEYVEEDGIDSETELQDYMVGKEEYRVNLID